MDDNTHLLLDFGDGVFCDLYGSNAPVAHPRHAAVHLEQLRQLTAIRGSWTSGG